MSWLVTGGAGYIGAHVVQALVDAGNDVVVVDDLSTGQTSRVPPDVPFVQGSLLDAELRSRVFDAHEITGVVHLAAKKRVDESVEKPSLYYHENVEGLRLLLDSCVAANVPSFLFSSSAAVYGETDVLPIVEESPCVPVSPYGQTKLAGEWLTHAVGAAAGMRTVALRYFNVAGTGRPEFADRTGMNLVPMLLRAIAGGTPPEIFGADYPTPDGTCVRDYIHVVDVAEAHVAAVRRLVDGSIDEPLTLNVGTGLGVSVREMVDTALRVTGSDLRPVEKPRRPGDPPAVVAAVDKAAKLLRWRSRFSVDDMVESAWQAWTAA
ncbi:MAG TPA: UDP-glucose 4-epimerase GalE [Jiangellaceae bacterium]